MIGPELSPRAGDGRIADAVGPHPVGLKVTRASVSMMRLAACIDLGLEAVMGERQWGDQLSARGGGQWVSRCFSHSSSWSH